MGLLDDYSGKGGLQGIGMTPRPTREHQNIMRMLIIGINNDDNFALSEQCINDSDFNSPAPDVLIYENETDKYPVTIIEITTTKDCKKIIQKVNELMNKYPQVKESFVYDYEKCRWFCFGDDLDDKNSSYSEIFNTDFNDYLN